MIEFLFVELRHRINAGRITCLVFDVFHQFGSFTATVVHQHIITLRNSSFVIFVRNSHINILLIRIGHRITVKELCVGSILGQVDKVFVYFPGLERNTADTCLSRAEINIISRKRDTGSIREFGRNIGYYLLFLNDLPCIEVDKYKVTLVLFPRASASCKKNFPFPCPADTTDKLSVKVFEGTISLQFSLLEFQQSGAGPETSSTCVYTIADNHHSAEKQQPRWYYPDYRNDKNLL